MNNNRWQLYEEREYKNISSMLDTRFGELIDVAKNQIKSGAEPLSAGRYARRQMEVFMESIDGYGASDTEPRGVLVTLVCTELGLPVDQETINKIQ